MLCGQPLASELGWALGCLADFQVLDLLDSAVLEHGQVGRGCRFATSCSGQICFAIKTCSWKPVQIGVAGQPLASELGLFDQCSWLLSTSRLAVLDVGRFAMLQRFGSLLGQRVGSVSLVLELLQQVARTLARVRSLALQLWNVGAGWQVCNFAVLELWQTEPKFVLKTGLWWNFCLNNLQVCSFGNLAWEVLQCQARGCSCWNLAAVRASRPAVCKF